MATATVLTLAAAAAAVALAIGAASPSHAAPNPDCHWEGSFRVCGGAPKPLLGPIKDITIRNPFYRNRDTQTQTVASAAPASPAQSASPSAPAAAANTGAAPPVLIPSSASPSALSRQAGAMIAAGDCAGARNAVLTAGDLALAVQVDQLCKR